MQAPQSGLSEQARELSLLQTIRQQNSSIRLNTATRSQFFEKDEIRFDGCRCPTVKVICYNL
jgi:hypothetical protein